MAGTVYVYLYMCRYLILKYEKYFDLEAEKYYDLEYLHLFLIIFFNNFHNAGYIELFCTNALPCISACVAHLINVDHCLEKQMGLSYSIRISK